MTKSTTLCGVASVALALTLAGCGGDGAATGAEGSSGVDTAAPLYDELPQAIKDEGELVFAADSHPPYRTVEADGTTITGIDPDIQDALSEALGVPIRMEVAEGLPQTITGMQSGRYDGFNGPVSATPERLAEFDGVAWLTTRTSYLIPTEGGIDAEDTGDLCGATIAGTKGSIVEDQIVKLSDWCEDEGRERISFLGLADTNATILAVQSGRADSAGITQTGALDLMRQQEGEWRYVSQTDEQGAGVDQLVLLTPRSAEMGEVMLAAFQEMFDNGTYDEIVEQWGLEDVAVDEPVLNPEVS